MLNHLLAIALVTSSLAYAGKESKGGDPRISDFRNRGRYAVEGLREGYQLKVPLEKGVDHLASVVDQVEITIVNFKKYEEQTPVRTVTSSGSPYGHRIEINADTWDETVQKLWHYEIVRLAFHEFLLAAGEKDEKEEISQHLKLNDYDPHLHYPLKETSISSKENKFVFSLELKTDVLPSTMGCTHDPEPSEDEELMKIKTLSLFQKKFGNWETDFPKELREKMDKYLPKQVKSVTITAKIEEPEVATYWLPHPREAEVRTHIPGSGVAFRYAARKCYIGYYGLADAKVTMEFDVDPDWSVQPLHELKLDAIKGKKYLVNLDQFSAKQGISAVEQARASLEQVKLKWEAKAQEQMEGVFPLVFIHTMRIWTVHGDYPSQNWTFTAYIQALVYPELYVLKKKS